MERIESRLLRALHREPAWPTSLLEAELQASAAELGAAVARLQAEGFRIETDGEGRLSWSGGPDRLDRDAIAARLNVECIGRQLQVYREVDSTNDLALQAALRGEHGVAILAESQRKGRGRRGRQWHSAPEYGLWFSVVLRFAKMPSPGLISAWPAVAIARVLREQLGLPIGIKWPNDLVAEGRKLGGILVENRQDTEGHAALAVGIGLNLLHTPEDFPDELRHTACSLRMLTGEDVLCRNRWAARFLQALDDDLPLLTRHPVELLQRAAEWSTLLGRRVWVEEEGERRVGLAREFDEHYGLILVDSDGKAFTVVHGEVSCRPD